MSWAGACGADAESVSKMSESQSGCQDVKVHQFPAAPAWASAMSPAWGTQTRHIQASLHSLESGPTTMPHEADRSVKPLPALFAPRLACALERQTTPGQCTRLGMGLLVLAGRHVHVPLEWMGCTSRPGAYLLSSASAMCPAVVQERQAKMVDDLAEAQKLVVDLQAANAALKAKVERLQRAGHMEQGRGSRSGLGGPPGMWQVGRGACRMTCCAWPLGGTCQSKQAEVPSNVVGSGEGKGQG